MIKVFNNNSNSFLPLKKFNGRKEVLSPVREEKKVNQHEKKKKK